MREDLSKLDATIIIGIVTVFSYGIAYAYERSYQSWYGLSPTFIDLNVNTITKTLFFTFVTLLMSWLITSILSSRLNKWIYEFIQSERKKSLSVVIIILFIILLSAIKLGEYSASAKRGYMVIKEEDGLFVEITQFKDGIIVAPLNIETESIKPAFKFIEITDLKDTEMVYFEGEPKVEGMKNVQDLKE